MKHFLTSVLLLATVCYSTAQSLSPSVIASGGMYASNGTQSLSYTVGELAVTTLTAGGHNLTQGFQQPDDKDVSVTSLQWENLQVKLYPNPASETVNLWIKCDNNACAHLNVSIHDLLGRELAFEPDVSVSGNEKFYVFNVKSLAASMYFVRLHNDETSFSQIIKFNKTSL